MSIRRYLPPGALFILVMAAMALAMDARPVWVLKFSLFCWSAIGAGTISEELGTENEKFADLSFGESTKLLGKALLCGPYTKDLLHL